MKTATREPSSWETFEIAFKVEYLHRRPILPFPLPSSETYYIQECVLYPKAMVPSVARNEARLNLGCVNHAASGTEHSPAAP